jgi:ferrous iron transport protein B
VVPASPTIPSPRRFTVALVGNPNCGKTTLFNCLTGSNYKVANYPGVTVEKREGLHTFSDDVPATVIDLPGTYALSGSTIDEQIVTNMLKGELSNSPVPDLIIAVVDATNLERNLFLVSELIDTGTPIVLALTMMDIAEQRGLKMYVDLLGRELDVPIAPIVARNKRGIADLESIIVRELRRPSRSRRAFAWIPSDSTKRDALRASACPLKMGALSDASITEIASLRYAWIRSIVSRVTSRSAPEQTPSMKSIDSLLTSKVWGLPILGCIFALVFQAIFLWAAIPMEWVSSGIEQLSLLTARILPPGMLTELLTEGIIPGVGNVLVFVPQIAILFFFIGLLEESGYLSRAAFLLDNIMRKVGLQGRAFIPLLSSFACAVPGILSTRTIPSRTDRLTTIMIAPLMGCSARLPVYTVLIAAAVPPTMVFGFFSLQGLVLLSMYVLGILTACGVSWILGKALRNRESCFFVMEIPPLRAPTLRVVLRGVRDSVLSFVKNASTMILACSIIIWFLASYPKVDAGYSGNPVQASYAGQLGTFIEPAIRPLGFNWELGFSIIASFPAREVFVTGLSTVLSVQNDDEETHQGLLTRLREKQATGSFSPLIAVSLMVFYVFACQCVSTLAVCRRETGSWLWSLGMFCYMTALAYVASLITYQVGLRLL